MLTGAFEAPAIFLALKNLIFHHCRDYLGTDYTDDLLILSKDLKSHCEQLEIDRNRFSYTGCRHLQRNVSSCRERLVLLSLYLMMTALRSS